MPEEAMQRQIQLCEATKGTEAFAENVESLLRMLRPLLRASVENDERVYKLSDGYVNRFINNVVITVEFTTVRTFDHDALFEVILEKLKNQ